jgi:hypothetical protein
VRGDRLARRLLATGGVARGLLSDFSDAASPPPCAWALKVRRGEQPGTERTAYLYLRESDWYQFVRCDAIAAQLATLGMGAMQPPPVSGPPPDDRFVRAGVLPRRVEIERNGFRTADTASVTLDWKDVPFDPRLVRACGQDDLASQGA